MPGRSLRLRPGDVVQEEEAPEIQDDIEALLSTCLDARRRAVNGGGGASSSKSAPRLSVGGVGGGMGGASSSRPLPRMPSLDSSLFSLHRESSSVMPQQVHHQAMSHRLHYDAAPTHMLGHSSSARNLHAHPGGVHNVPSDAAAAAAFQRQQLSVLHETRQASREGSRGGSREKLHGREKISYESSREKRSRSSRTSAPAHDHVQMSNEGAAYNFEEEDEQL